MAAAACGAVTAAGASPLDISYEEIPLEKIKAEDTLILSDSPEYARNYGICLLYTSPSPRDRG